MKGHPEIVTARNTGGIEWRCGLRYAMLYPDGELWVHQSNPNPHSPVSRAWQIEDGFIVDGNRDCYEPADPCDPPSGSTSGRCSVCFPAAVDEKVHAAMLWLARVPYGEIRAHLRGGGK